jgi:hypothetical protein
LSKLLAAMAPDRERQTKPNEPERARRRIQHNKNLTQWKPKSEAGEKSHLKQAARENEDRMAAPGACTARTEDGRLNTEQKEKEPGEELSEQKPKSERETISTRDPVAHLPARNGLPCHVMASQVVKTKRCRQQKRGLR